MPVESLEDFSVTSSRENEYYSNESSCLVYSETVNFRKILSKIRFFGVNLEIFLRIVRKEIDSFACKPTAVWVGVSKYAYLWAGIFWGKLTSPFHSEAYMITRYTDLSSFSCGIFWSNSKYCGRRNLYFWNNHPKQRGASPPRWHIAPFQGFWWLVYTMGDAHRWHIMPLQGC